MNHYRSLAAVALQEHLKGLRPGELVPPRDVLCREHRVSTKVAQRLINEALEAGFITRGHGRCLHRTDVEWWCDLVAVPVTAGAELWRIVVCGGGKTKKGKRFKKVWSWHYDDGERAIEKYRKLTASKRGCLVRLERVVLAGPWQVVDSAKQEWDEQVH